MYDLVTFDIFDTLVHRKLRAPVDVFEAVRVAVLQRDIAILHHDLLVSFTHHRMRAESEAREIMAGVTGGEGEITFEEIYDRYEALTGCRSEIRRLLQETELELEKTFLFASEKGRKVFDEFKSKTKKIAFISDMYLPSSWLKCVLEEKGFSDLSEIPIFVSGEFRKSKHSGALYAEVRDRLKISLTDSWLHIGDNPWADIEQAKKNSIKTLLADWVKVDNRRMPPTHPRSDYMVSSVVDFLKTPQAIQFLPKEEYESLGYRIFGPLIFGFILWLCAKMRESKVERVAFIARDGWLPYRLFESLKGDAGLESIASSYLYFSRRVGHQLGVKEWDVERTWAPFAGKVARPIEDCLETVGYNAEAMPHLLEQFGLTLGRPVSHDKINAGRALLGATFDVGLKAARDRRQRFRSYFDSHFVPGVKTGLVDIGWNGNIQRYLLGALDQAYSKEHFIGLYLGLHSSATPNRDLGFAMQGWLSHYGNRPHVQEYLQSGGVELLEFALTADHGTTLGYDINEKGEVVPALEEILPEEREYREKAMKVQHGVSLFVEDHRYLLRIYEPAAISSPIWALPFERLVTDPEQGELDLLAGLSHSDTAGVTSTRLTLAARQPDDVRKSKKRMLDARNEAFWKIAFDRLNS
ncbi:HAD-IA family hydrolase [Agrobacterium sp.]|uniref:HAD-IA family hydrolase n=1 Tax=Agrobacterium sp. TaxID=361 RepID=UPI00289B7206|nr:HAD-IA family hydrolase [Agrobacterium sp.]